MVTQLEIARRTGLDVSSVNKILNKRSGPVFRKETIRRVFKVAREMGFDFGRLKFQHRRRYPRRSVAIGADFVVHRNDGSLYDVGSATIRDISACGARVTDVTLPTGSLPVDSFSVTLRPKAAKDAEAVEVRGRIVRYQGHGVAGYGIEFGALERGQQLRLQRIANG